MIEIIAMSVEDAKKIEYCGANRIELVCALTEGGLTPSFGLLENVIKNVSIPVNVMIRHHNKNFSCSEYDLRIMKNDIQIVKELGANGVVLGSLDNNRINENDLNILLEDSKGLEITFHRAFDETNVKESLEILKKYDITNILTSGGKGKIENNLENLEELVKLSDNINILVGGGLNLENILHIKETTRASDFHFGTAVRFDKNPFKEIDEKELKKLVNMIS